MSHEIVSDYKHDPELRGSFNQLTKMTFGLSFEEWYAGGFWDDTYVCHSIVENGAVISNVSATRMELLVNGESRRAFQIGTVMTHPDHKGKGLAGRLMRAVIEEYEKKVDFMYLFANDMVLDFYPKYGFDSGVEYAFSTTVNVPSRRRAVLKKVNIADHGELADLYQAVLKRTQISKQFDTRNSASLYMWHCLFDLRNDIYRIGNSSSYVVFREESGSIVLFDIISEHKIDLDEILSGLGRTAAGAESRRIRFHFIPDFPETDNANLEAHPNEHVFVRPFTLFGEARIAHPVMGMA